MLQPVDRLLAAAATRKLVRELMLEVIAAANVQLPDNRIADSYADSMIDFTDKMGEYRPSMQIDRAEGRELEVDAIFRKSLAAGMAKGVAMPRVEMLATLLEQVQAG